jgi:hypothetical protein
MRAVLAFACLFLFGAKVIAQTVCSDASLRSSSILQQVQPLDQFEGMKNSDLVIIGEMHYVTDPTVLQEILNLFAKSADKKACLFMEFSSAITPHVFLSKAKEALASLPPGDSVERRDLSEFLGYFGPLVSKADELRMAAFSVDHPENFGQGMDIGIRDEAMSNRIQSLLKSGDCGRALLFVGKAHVSADEISRYTLKQRLLDSQLSLTAINVQHASDPGPEALASWSQLCPKESLLMPRKPVVFHNQLFSINTPLWPNMIGGKWIGGLWRDFDYTILAP